MSLRAIRGAITVEEDRRELIVEATSRMLLAMLGRNGLGPDRVLSVLFTSTPDLRSAFTTEGLEGAGLSGVPALCATDLLVEGAPPRCIRALLHCETEDAEGPLHHVLLVEPPSTEPSTAG